MANLIAFDKNHNLQYEGYCKISVNKLSSMLIVEPKNEEYKMISASFNAKYALQKNLLFVLAEYDFLDFCLIFQSEKLCKNVYQNICQQKDNKTFPDKSLIDDRLVIPMFDKIKENPPLFSELTKILAQWINILDKNVQQNYINLCKEKNIYDQIFSIIKNMESQKETKNSIVGDKAGKKIWDNGGKNSRKRKHDEICKNNEKTIFDGISLQNTNSQIIRSPQFKMLYFPERRPQTSLIIFTSSEQLSFHEYREKSIKSNIFICKTCFNPAVMGYDENGNVCAKLKQIQHNCDPISDINEQYSEIKIIKKIDYEIVNNYGDARKKFLVTFDSNEKNMCHDFFLKDRSALKYGCRNCQKMNKCGKNECLAKIRNKETCHEYLELINDNDNHTCKKIKYNTNKYQKVYKHILKPGFVVKKVHRYNREMEALMIFDEKDENLCNIYLYSEHAKCFICHNCRKKGKSMRAKLRQNSDGEEYVILVSAEEHVCKLNPIPKEDVILRVPQIEFLKETKTGTPKIFVFENESRKMCYVFSQEKKMNKYSCNGCSNINKICKNKNTTITGYLSINENDKNDFYFYMKDKNQRHICKPKKYDPKKYQSFKTTDFFYFRQNIRENNLRVAIYHPSNRKLCYTFSRNKADNRFYCGKCCGKKRSVSIAIKRDTFNDEEYFEHDFERHLCEPIEVSKIIEFIIHEKEDAKEEKVPFESNEIEIEVEDESKIIRKPNFELQPSQNGIPNGRLIIFHPNDKSLVYQYYYKTDGKRFRCYQCEKRKHPVSAKLQVDANNQKYILMEKNEHICEPLKYQPMIMYESPNYVILNPETKNTKIYTFTSSTKEFCYEFSFFILKNVSRFRCLGCFRLKKNVYAKIIMNENGQQCITVTDPHICEPKKYETFETKKIISEEMFELCPNSNGKKDGTLLIFASEIKDFVYSYSKNSTNYICNKCAQKKLRVTAKIKKNEESGEIYAELFGPEHVCAPKKYIFYKKDVQTETIPESNFTFSENSKGEKNKRLIIFTSDARKFCYKFHWCFGSTYKCNNCYRKKKQNVSAKLQINANGQKYVEMKNGRHICCPEKYHQPQ